MAEWRQIKKRGRQILTVIDPNIRLRNSLPILDIAAEKKHYELRNPYGKQDQYCEDHYICLWQVTKEEIIFQEDWDDIVETENWFEAKIMPFFRESLKGSVQSAELSTDLSRVKRKFTVCRSYYYSMADE
jgi:hypothetical protein